MRTYVTGAMCSAAGGTFRTCSAEMHAVLCCRMPLMLLSMRSRAPPVSQQWMRCQHPTRVTSDGRRIGQHAGCTPQARSFDQVETGARDAPGKSMSSSTASGEGAGPPSLVAAMRRQAASSSASSFSVSCTPAIIVASHSAIAAWATCKQRSHYELGSQDDKQCNGSSRHASLGTPIIQRPLDSVLSCNQCCRPPPDQTRSMNTVTWTRLVAEAEAAGQLQRQQHQRLPPAQVRAGGVARRL